MEWPSIQHAADVNHFSFTDNIRL